MGGDGARCLPGVEDVGMSGKPGDVLGHVVDCVTRIEAERADAVPAVFTRIHLHFEVSGRKLKDNTVRRAVEMSAEKYCSASIMLERGGVTISHDYEVIEVD